ncbi:MAG: 23S rRNA (uracil(1939)-C(5))-methyltransferase RlmD [Patescibacteria group bacterium]
MKFGHRIKGTITGYDEKGRGFFYLPTEDGKTTNTFVAPFSAQGDEIVGSFIKRDHGVKILKIEELVKPSQDRTTAPCPHAGVCGGCPWQHLNYEAQLDIKRNKINDAFQAAGHDEKIDQIIPAKKKFHYRNRMDFAVGWNGEIGLKEYSSWNRYVDLTTCLLLNDGVGEILQHVHAWMRESDLQPWDAKFYTGDIRYVVIREGKNTKQRMISIIAKDLSRLTPVHRSSLIAHLSPFCTTLLIGEQSLNTDISLAQKFECLKGEPFLEEIVNDVRYKISPNSFFQTNSAMAAELQKTVDEFIRANGSHSYNVLDLYCGLGFFGIYLAKQHPDFRVAGFEIDAQAIELAKQNALCGGVSDRTEFTSGPAEDLSWKNIEADIVILDPPRSGLHPRVLKTLLEKKPETIIYVSCNFRRLVEELKILKTVYRIEKLRALDLFPQTPHVEVIAYLRRIK